MPGAVVDEQPIALHRRLPADATLADRLRVADRARRLVPATVALRVVRRRAARRWEEEPAVSEEALRRLHAIVDGTPRAPDVERLARAAVMEDACFAELFLRPWLLRRRRVVEGGHHLAAAVATGRGVLVSYCHLGPFQGTSAAVHRAGPVPWIYAGSWIAGAPLPGELGRLLERWRGFLGTDDVRVLLTTTGALDRGTALLRRGEVLCVLFDLPGGTETHWLGKPVELASGSARMAQAGDALVVPVSSRRDGTKVISSFLDPLDPRRHASPEELHHALAGVHERAVLARPEALENPLRSGYWQDGVTPERWRAPTRRM